ncbi:MAG: hypothetical protein QOI65_1535 [Thermoleophilaceae bacterium]|nr:hypothetical protein [Thermoleophilaceae bacterium]
MARQLLGRHVALSGFVAFALVAGISRVGNYNAPLIGDVTQFLYVGDIVAHGGTPYLDAAYSKGPLTALLFAAIEPLAGTSTALVRLSVVPFAAAAALALAGYVAHYAGRAAGALAGVGFAVLSGLQRLDGAEGKSEQYGVAPLYGALWLATRTGRWAAPGAGALVGCAVLINPAFVLGVPPVALQLWLSATGAVRRRKLFLAGAGLLAPVALACAWLAAAGALDDMLIQVGGQVADAVRSEHVPTAAAPIAADLFSTRVLGLPPMVLWLPGLAGCALALRDRTLRPGALVLGLVMVATAVRVKAPIYSIDYQFYPAVPALCGAIALGLASLSGLSPRRRALLAAAVLAPALWTLVVHPQIDLLGREPVDRVPQGREVYAVGNFVRRHTTPSQRIIVAGGRAEVYWVARRRAPTRFFDAFGRNGDPHYPVERRRDLRRRPPAAVVIMSTERLTERDVQPLIRSRRYVEAYSRGGDHVWLRRRA